MNSTLSNYLPIVGPQVINELEVLSQSLKGTRIKHINSTAVGGGVAEILIRMMGLGKDLGLEMTWDVIRGNDAFYQVTKAMHNAFHGTPFQFTPEMWDSYRATTEENIKTLDLNADVFLIHDPQPAALVTERTRTGGKWIWRCHIDLSNRQPAPWEFIEPFVARYDAAVFSSPKYIQNLLMPEVLIPPSIDPLSDKNRDLPPEFVTSVLERFNIDPKRPILTQISRFDRLKDPIGVCRVYQVVKKSIPELQLVLAGGGASDDPEGAEVLAEVREAAGNDPDIHILELPPTANMEINALQHGSTIVMQKSLKEGFGLTVSEGMWKGKPVVASAVGGIVSQIHHGITGELVHSESGAAQSVKKLLVNPEYAKQLGVAAKEHVRNNFLLTRHLKDYMLLFLFVMKGSRQGIISG
jgi:trehalose synthase